MSSVVGNLRFWRRESRNDYSLATQCCQARKAILFAGNRAQSVCRRLFACLTSGRAHHRPLRTTPRRVEVGRVATIQRVLDRTTNATPPTVNSMPLSMMGVKASPNRAHAISAVHGGTRYIRLVTVVAAPRWISR